MELKSLQPGSQIKSRQWPVEKNAELTLTAHRRPVMRANASDGSRTFLLALQLIEQEVQTVRYTTATTAGLRLNKTEYLNNLNFICP